MIATVRCQDERLRHDAIDVAGHAEPGLVGVFRRVYSITWIVTTERDRTHVVAKLRTRSGSYTAATTGASLEASFREVVARIKGQRRRRKVTRLRSRNAAIGKMIVS